MTTNFRISRRNEDNLAAPPIIKLELRSTESLQIFLLPLDIAKDLAKHLHAQTRILEKRRRRAADIREELGTLERNGK